MKIIRNRMIPFKGFSAINLFGVVFVRKGARVTRRMITHETIHTAQMKELGYVPFYLIYLTEGLFKFFVHGKKVYRNISFEREAHGHDRQPAYPGRRERFATRRYLVR